MPRVPEITPEQLARRLDEGEPLQVLDIRAPERVRDGHITLGQEVRFAAMAGSQIYRLPSLAPLGLDPGRPVAVVCGHGNSSRQATAFLRDRGLEAYSVAGGMAAWETVYLARPIPSAGAISHALQLDRIGKGALSYILVSEGEAVVVDPGRHVERYEAAVRDADARPVAVIDTHMHADYLSGASRLAAAWGVPYYLHPDDATSPYDGTPGRVPIRPVRDGDTIPFGRAALRVLHTPGHTLGHVALVADDALALTGDFVFVESIGRPDLGGQSESWSQVLWQTVQRARREWSPDWLVLPAHYTGESERAPDRTISARFASLLRANTALGYAAEADFRAWIRTTLTTPPDAYRSIKLANLGLQAVAPEDAEILEAGPNLCAVR